MKEVPFEGQNKAIEPANSQEIKRDLAAVIAEKEPESVVTFRSFLKFLREKVTSDELIADRVAQAKIAKIVHRYSFDEELGSPYPEIELQTQKLELDDPEKRPTSFFPGYTRQIPFMLKGDNEYFYYSDHVWSAHYRFNMEKREEEWVLPFCLRPEDLVPPEEYGYEKYKLSPHETGVPYSDVPGRLPIKGGKPEIYNFKTEQWEESGEGVYEGADEVTVEKALNLLATDEAELVALGEKIKQERETGWEAEQKKREKRMRRGAFSFSLKEEEITFKTGKKEDRYQFLSNYLVFLGYHSRLLKIRPDIRTRLRVFNIIAPKHYSVFPFEEERRDVVEEKAENRDDIPAFFLGAFNHPRIVNMTFRLIAIPVDTLPKDTAFDIGVREENETRFKSSQLINMVVTKISVTDESVRPPKFKDGKYIIFAAQDLLDPVFKRDDRPPSAVRIVGLSKKKKSLFYKDVDVSGVSVKFMRIVEEKEKIERPKSKKLPPVSNLLPDK